MDFYDNSNGNDYNNYNGDEKPDTKFTSETAKEARAKRTYYPKWKKDKIIHHKFTTEDIAAACNVSTKTVVRAINNKKLNPADPQSLFKFMFPYITKKWLE